MTGSNPTRGKPDNNPDSKVVSSAEFAELMAPLEIRDRAPRIAVGVSGGPDSMALAVLADQWVSARGGDLVALIVDHGLRPESAEEAHRAAGWLADRGIQSEILCWHGAKPSTGLQAAARMARYRLLTDGCMARGITDLLLAHHRDDQAETFLLRLGRGSGVDGLACMAPLARSPVPHAPDIRLVRPFLPVPKTRLTATLKFLDVPWIEDPSNQNIAFTRVRMRRALKEFAGEGFTSERLSVAARRMDRASEALRAATRELLDRSVLRDPAGFCEMSVDEFQRVPDEISLRALAQMLIWAGGPGAVPRLERIERLHHEFVINSKFSGRTLGGCRVERLQRARGQSLLVCREAGAATQVLPLSPGTEDRWDGRFQVALGGGWHDDSGAGVPNVRRLGDDGWREISRAVADFVRHDIPAPARPALPALWDQNGVVSVPLAGYCRPDSIGSLAVFTTDVQWNTVPKAYGRWG